MMMNNKNKVNKIMAIAKCQKPTYWIYWTIWKGELVILDGRKSYDINNNHPNLLYFQTFRGQTKAEKEELQASVSSEDVIKEFERNGVNHKIRAEISKIVEAEIENDRLRHLHDK